jgi:hypothetical protein
VNFFNPQFIAGNMSGFGIAIFLWAMLHDLLPQPSREVCLGISTTHHAEDYAKAHGMIIIEKNGQSVMIVPTPPLRPTP